MLGCPTAGNGNPCDAATGNKYQSESDWNGGQGLPALIRYYNSGLTSQFNADSGLGHGWTSTTHPHLEDITADEILVRRANGQGLIFRNFNGLWRAEADIEMSFTQDTAGYSLTLRNGTTERYDTTGKLLSEISPSGEITNYGYDGNSRLTTVTNAFGHSLTFGYGANNHVSTVINPAGQVIGYAYDTNNNLTRVDYPDATAKIYHYEDSNNPHGLTGISHVDSIGAVTRYSTYGYDATGKAIRTEHAQTDNVGPQEKLTLTYNSDTQTTVTDPVNMNEVMTFATNLGVKNLTSKVNSSDSKSVAQTFDANNNLTCRKDEENRVTLYSYNSTNQKLSMTEGLSGTDCNACLTNPANCNVGGVGRVTTYDYFSPTLDLPRFIRRPSVASGQTFETEIQYGDAGHPNLPTQIIQRGFTPAGAAVSRTVTLGYNASGQVISINGPRTDVNDITTLEYNECTTGGACGQLQRITNALGHITTYDLYDANGRLQQMTDPNGLRTSYSYDERGRVKTVTQTPASGVAAITRYSYTAWGDVAQVIDPDGVVLNYQYDAAHYLRYIVDAAGNYIHYNYDLKGNRTSEDVYDSGGNLKRTAGYAYDLRNHLSQINNAGNITQLVNDAVGNLTRETDPNNNPATQHTPDALSRLVQTIDRLGGTTGYGYDINDRPTHVTPPGKSATQYTYDDLGNLLKEVSPDRGTTNYTYDTAGNLKTVQTARGPTLTYTYDTLNRPTLAVPLAFAYRATYVYDSCANGIGRLCSVNNSFSTVTYGYDGLGNVTGHQSLAYAYTAAGRLRTISYPSSAVVTYDYDTAGQVSQVYLTRNGATQVIASGIQHAPFGPIKAMNYGNGKTLSQALDTAYRIRSKITPGVLELDYPLYDANGNLRQHSEALSALSSSFTYDALDRLDTANNPGFLNYDYDANGNRTLFQQGFTITSYGYSPNTNRLTQVGTTAVTLDANGNITAQGTRTYVYTSAFDHLTQVLDNGSQIAGYAYNVLGQRVRKQANGTTTSYLYGLDGFLRVETSSGTTPREYIYLNGEPLAVMDQAISGSNTPALAVTTVPAIKSSSIGVNWNGIASPTAYDWVGIYVPGSNEFAYLDWAYTNGAASGTVSVSLAHPSIVAGGTYEARLYANDGYTLLAKSAPFVINPTGTVVAVTSAPVIKGQSITTKWSGIATPTSYDWVGIYVPGSADAAYLDWAYTNGGNSGTVNVTLNHPSLVAGGTYEARLYANDGYTLLAKTPPFTVVANTGQSTPAALYYYHTDHRGTPQAMTNEAGAVVWRATYDPFGWATVTVNTITNNLRDAGQYFDSETGLHYWGARYYDPKTGRGISADGMSVAEHVARWREKLGAPNQPPLELNPYAYVVNNPLRWIDLTGFDATDWNNTTGGRSRWSGPTNGNWGGKCWSGGAYSCGGNPPGNAAPTDSADQCYQRHDNCYVKCGANAKCIAACNRTLDNELGALPDDPRLWPQPPRPGTERDSRGYRTGARMLF
jgi:RHS repeat-associated protein